MELLLHNATRDIISEENYRDLLTKEIYYIHHVLKNRKGGMSTLLLPGSL